MGSLGSRPQVPQQPQIITVAQPAPAPVTTPQSSGDTSVETQEAAAEARRQSVLGRDRSRFGTIRTGFRGLLGLADQSAQRKTLLGE